MIIVTTFAFAKACLRDSTTHDGTPEFGSPEYYAYAAELSQRKPEATAQYGEYPPPPQQRYV